MKNFKLLFGLLLVPLFFVGCEDEFVDNQNPAEQTMVQNHEFKNHHLIDYCVSVENDLFAGQDIDVGSVIIGHDMEYLYVTFITEGEWWLTNTKVWVGTEQNPPVTKKGNPKRGHFDPNMDHYPFTQAWTYVLDLPSDWVCGDMLYVATHADVVTYEMDGEEIIITREETAWGFGDYEFDGSAWGWYEGLELFSCCPTNVYVMRNGQPWTPDQDVQTLILNALGVTYTYVTTDDLPLELDPCHDLVIITGDQDQAFYDALAGNEGPIYDFVVDGGKLIWEASDNGWKMGDLNAAGVVFPLGIGYVFSTSSNNFVVSGLPPVDGLPSPMYGSFASHGYFTNLPDEALVHTDDGNYPTMIELEIGMGKVLMATQPIEYNFVFNSDMHDLINRVYAYMTCLSVPIVAPQGAFKSEAILPTTSVGK